MDQTLETYFQQNKYNKQKEPIDWYEFLNRKSYTIKDLTEARAEASSWIACACGNQCSVIPRNGDGAPLDKILRSNGIEFYRGLRCMSEARILNDFKNLFEFQKQTLKILKKIEARSVKILNKMLESGINIEKL